MILEYLPIIEHYAHGGELEFHSFAVNGADLGWSHARGLLIQCLPNLRAAEEPRECPQCARPIEKHTGGGTA
jgi:hypothetical protein